MSLQSTTIYDRRVYAQDTEPSDKRDGNLWVDTSASPPDTKTYDADTGVWEPVAAGKVSVSDAAPTGVNEGHLWVDTSEPIPDVKVLDSTGTWRANSLGWKPLKEATITAGATSYGASVSVPGSWDRYRVEMRNWALTGSTSDTRNGDLYARLSGVSDSVYSYVKSSGNRSTTTSSCVLSVVGDRFGPTVILEVEEVPDGLSMSCRPGQDRAGMIAGRVNQAGLTFDSIQVQHIYDELTADLRIWGRMK